MKNLALLASIVMPTLCLSADEPRAIHLPLVASSSESEKLSRKLDYVVFDHLLIERVSFLEALELFSDAYSGGNPNGENLEFAITVNAIQSLTQQDKVRVSLKNVPAIEALRYLAQLADLRISIVEGIVLIYK